jgi:sporulation protein YlmC with PRC-barrel domain
MMVINRKNWLLAIPLALVAALMLSACATNNATAEPTQEGTAMAPTAEGGMTAEPTAEGNMTQEPTAEGNMTAEPTAEGEMAETPMAGEALPYVQTTTLIGSQVADSAGDNVGEISDVLANMDGTVEYIMLNTTSMSGGDQQYVLLPWSSFEYHGNEEMDTESSMSGPLVYTGSMSDIESAPVVDHMAFEGAGLVINAADNGVDAQYDGLIQLSYLDDWSMSGYDFVNDSGDSLGNIQDSVIDASQGKVIYAVADVGNFLGTGSNPIAIPWDRLSFNTDSNQITLSASKEELAGAPLFDTTDWGQPGMPAASWDAPIQSYWTGMS